MNYLELMVSVREKVWTLQFFGAGQLLVVFTVHRGQPFPGPVLMHVSSWSLTTLVKVHR